MRRRKVHRLSVAALLAVLLAAATPTFSEAEVLIIQANDHAELKKKWCTADPNVEHVLVLPASLFVDSEQLICDSGPYKLYRVIESDDPMTTSISSIRRSATRRGSAAMGRPDAPCRPSR